jgi:hypothetical protein
MKKLRIGLSEIVITPPVGVRLSGYGDRTAASTGVLDDLYAKAVVFDNGDRRLALVVCDLLGLGRPVVAAIRDAVRKHTGMEASDVMVTATHTHCGPDVDLLGDAALDHLVELASGSVRAAAGALTDAAVGFGAGTCLAGVSRRHPRAPRAPYFLYSYPEGTMDTRVLVMSVRDAAGAARGAVVNYACHPVTLGWNELGMSKDYVEYTCGVLKSAWGPRAVPVFLQGCAGNVNPRWVYDRPEVDPIQPPDWPEGLDDRLRETRRLGRMLGGAALDAAETVTRYERDVPLDARLVEVRLPLRPSPDDTDGPPKPRPRTRYPCRAERFERDPAAIDTDIQVLRVGPTYFVGLPGEIFVEYQLELREKIASPFVFVSGLAGDSIGYVTPPAAFAEGGYEPGATYVTPEAGGILVAAVLDAVKSLEAGAGR